MSVGARIFAACASALRNSLSSFSAAGAAGRAAPPPCALRRLLAHFIVMVGVQELQSIEMLALVQSRVKMPLFGAVSAQRPFGVP